MNSWRWNINGIFWALALACFLTGCKTAAEKKEAKEQTLIKIHLEMVPDNKSDQWDVPVYRQHPVMVHVDTKEILNNVDIREASVVDVQGGFGIRLVFDEHGSRVLENITARNMGKRLAIYAAWPEVRWLAAPLIKKRIGEGAFVFTPDATREEAERIVKGVNNVAKKAAKNG
jgi:preprotein translocase subunit SecD